jgi:hypothetical protein
MRLYRQLWAISQLAHITDYGEPLDFLVQNQIVAPLDKALFACHSAIKDTTPKDPREVELRVHCFTTTHCALTRPRTNEG